MNENDIRHYASLMQELELSALEIREDGISVRLERDKLAAAAPAEAVIVPPAQKSEEGEIVKCPMIGVFYQASAENAEPYVKIGDKVKPGDTLCIIESMKLMNEIKAECAGRILEIYAKNGELVDYGAKLFRIGE